MIDNRIENLNLSIRAYNCLKSAGIITIEEMALIDLHSIKNCGRKTVSEINKKIEQLRVEGRYSKEFIDANFGDNTPEFIDSLDISVRSRNILKRLGINNENDLILLNYDKLKNTKNVGITSVNEIINYIENNKSKLETQAASNGNIIYSVPVNMILGFCGNTLIEDLPMNILLKEEFKRNNIITIIDLLLNKMTFDNSIMPLYNSVYDYFYNIAYSPLDLSLSAALSDLYVYVPFSMLDLNENYYIKVSSLIEYITDHFGEMELEDKLNSKLFLYWINSFDIVDKKKYFIDKLMLRDKEYKILSLRETRTLEEVGQMFGVTRERIRQIESKAISKINQKYKYIPFGFIDNKKIYYVDEIDDFYSLLLYIETIRDENSYVFINNRDKSYYLPTFYIEKMKLFINDNISQFENQGFIELDMNVWCNKDILNKVVEYLNYNLNKNKLTKKLTKRLQVKYAMKYLARPISISSLEDQKEIVRTVKELFGNDLEPGRGMEALICEAGVRIDSGKYAASDNIEALSENTLSKIVQFVKEREIINARDLFIIFGDEFIDHNLNNESILYRYLKETLSNKLFFHGASAVISSDPSLTGWGDLAIKIMNGSHKPINKLNFMVDHSLTEVAYSQLPIYFDDIIIWSKKEIYLKSLLDAPDKIINQIISYITKNQIVKFDEIRRIINRLDINLLSRNNIKTNDNLFNYLLNILPDDFEIDKRNEEIRCKENVKIIIEEVYKETEELTL